MATMDAIECAMEENNCNAYIMCGDFNTLFSNFYEVIIDLILDRVHVLNNTYINTQIKYRSANSKNLSLQSRL